MPIFTTDIDADGVATITWDLPGRSMNVLDEDGIAELDAAIDATLADDAVKGIVITSAKKDFAGGMDLNVLARMKESAGDDPARGLFEGTMRMHAMLRKLERAGMDSKTLKGGKPVAWAAPGTSAGIGTEIGLACHRRFMADNPKAKVGLPEILVGIFPGAGGTTRVSRMLGVMGAAPILLEGRMLAPKAAKAAGLIDEVTAPDALLATARAWVLSATDADIVKPWDAKGYKYPGGAPYNPSGFMTFVGASAMVHGKTQGALPAPQAMLSAIYEGALVPFDTALKIEARWFTHILMNPSSAAMIRSLFINKQALEKGAVRPDVPDQSVRKLGVLGAGMMGAGIAYVAALAGIEVVLIDRDQQAADKGRAHAEVDPRHRHQAQEDHAREKGRSPRPHHRHPRLRRTEGLRSGDRGGVRGHGGQGRGHPQRRGPPSRRRDLRHQHLDAPHRRAGQGQPRRGKLHRHPLLLAGRPDDAGRDHPRRQRPATGRWPRALDFVRQIRKTPIVVNDARFFYANRCVIPYINEGVRMVAEGIAPPLIENAAKQLGFPLGPLQLTDETSIDLAVKIARATRAAMGDAYPDSPADDVVFRLAELGRLGRKAKAGFYAYDEAGKRQGLWPDLARHWPVRDDQPDLVEVQHRLAMVQTLEAVRALEEGVLTDIREGDVGAILGWGYMPWSGGPFSWLDILGAPRAVEIADGLAAAHGPRFAPPALLRDLAATGETFYGRFNTGEKAA